MSIPPGSGPLPSPMGLRADSTGTLKTTIVLGKNPSVMPGGPFYLIRQDAAAENEGNISGSLNLLEYHDLESAYQKMTLSKRPKDELSQFLPGLPGFLDTPSSEDQSSLRELFENPPRARKEIELLPLHLLHGFRLRPGSVPEKYRYMDNIVMKRLHKKKRKTDDVQESEASPESKKLRNEKEEERRKRRDRKRKRKEEHGST